MNREKKSEIIRQSILTAAADLFEQNGFENTKVNDIAAKADLSKATFYAYFKRLAYNLRCNIFSFKRLRKGSIPQIKTKSFINSATVNEFKIT